MLMVGKAWRSAIVSIICNCFRKCGFSIDSQLNEVPQIAPTPYDSHPILGDVPFEDYFRIDVDIAAWGVLSDAEIMASQDTPQACDRDQIEDDEDRKLQLVALKSVHPWKSSSLQV